MIGDKTILFLLAAAIILKTSYSSTLLTVVSFSAAASRRRRRFLDYFYVTMNFSVFAMQSRNFHRSDAKEVDFMMLVDGYIKIRETMVSLIWTEKC